MPQLAIVVAKYAVRSKDGKNSTVQKRKPKRAAATSRSTTKVVRRGS